MDILVSEVQGEMANQFLQMGDQNTADVKLQLLDEDGVEYEGIDHLYLHSQQNLSFTKGSCLHTKGSCLLNSL